MSTSITSVEVITNIACKMNIYIFIHIYITVEFPFIKVHPWIYNVNVLR